MENSNQINMENMELDEIGRLISKLSSERFQIEMENLEYRRRNCDLEHRIKMLRLQLEMPKTIDYETFKAQMSNALLLEELNRAKINAIEQNYHQHLHNIQASYNEIIDQIENLAIVKKIRYLENKINLKQREIAHLENCILVSKQLNGKIYNHANFVLKSVIHWKVMKTQDGRLHFNEICNEIGITRKEIMMMENRLTEVRKLYEQLEMEIKLKHFKVPRTTDKLEINFDLLEQNDDVKYDGSFDSKSN